jgi:hypothetical protein
MIDWKKRCKRQDTILSKRRVWESKCGIYKVEESDIQYGKRESSIPIYYRAMVKRDWGWEIISFHRKRKPATKALEKLEKGK